MKHAILNQQLPLHFGVIHADSAQRQAIAALIGEYEAESGIACDLSDLEAGFGDGVDIYLTVDPLSGDKRANLSRYVYSVDVGVIPPASGIEFASWKQGIKARIAAVVQAYQARIHKIPATEVWLLAASTGGLQAVAKFLFQARQRSGLGFVYAQHIEVEQQEQLVKLVKRHSSWGAQIGDVGDCLAEGYVTIISPGERVSFGANGRIVSTDQSWSGPYRPSIDDLSSELAANYRQCSGMIVFTGMGDDGVRGSKMIRASGGSVWVQAPDTCTAPALPEAVRISGEYDYCADIESLGNKFNERVDKPRSEALAQ